MTLTGFFDLVAGEQQAAEGAADQGFQVAAILDGGAGVAGDPFGQALLAGEFGAVVLRVVAREGLFRPLDGAELRRQFAHQQLQEGRLADAVFTDHGDSFHRR